MAWIALDIKGGMKVLNSLDCTCVQYMISKMHDLFMFIEHRSNEKEKGKLKSLRVYV